MFSLPVNHYLAYASCIAREIAAEHDIHTTDGTVESNLRDVWDYDPDVLWSVGHGSSDAHTVECREYFLVTGRDPMGIGLMGGRVVHLLSCLCGRDLVPDLVDIGGADAALGYSEEFTLAVTLEGEPDPCTPPDQEQDFYTFSDCDLEVQRALLAGKSIREAYKASQEKFEREIERYETGDRSEWAIAPWAARHLLHDKEAQVLFEAEVAPSMWAAAAPVLKWSVLLGVPIGIALHLRRR